MPDSKYRFLIVKIVMFIMLVAIAARLFNLQIINGSEYLKTATSRLSSSVVNKAARGDILDKYGNVLVTNKTG